MSTYMRVALTPLPFGVVMAFLGGLLNDTWNPKCLFGRALVAGVVLMVASLMALALGMIWGLL